MKLNFKRDLLQKIKIEQKPQKPQPSQPDSNSRTFSKSKIADAQFKSQNMRFLLEKSLPLTQPGNIQNSNQPLNLLAGETVNSLSLTQQEEIDQEAQQKADEILENHGGADDINEDEAVAIGGEIADIAKTDPALAIAVMTIVQEELADTDKPDNVSSGFIDSLTDEQLQSVARTEGGKETLTNLVEHLLTGSVHPEEEEEALRIVQAIALSGSLEPGTFTTLEGIAAADSYLTTPGTEVPELTAQAIQDEQDTEKASQMYLTAVEEHKDDPEWLNSFYQTLGTERTAEVLTYLSNSPATSEEQLQAIGQSFETLTNAGLLNQTDIDILMVTMTGNVGFGVPEFFSKILSGVSDSDAAVQLKNMFADTMARISTGKLPIAVYSDGGILQDVRSSFAAYATQILSTTPEDNQIEQLTQLHTTLGKEGFNTFISAAMSSEDCSEEAIEKLLNSVVNTGDSELQKNLFNAINQGLTNPSTLERFKDNIEFKDNLSTIFIDNQDELLLDAQRDSEGADTGVFTDSFERGLEAFFQITLLTAPQGTKYEDLAASIYELINKGVTALDNPDLANREQGAFDSFVTTFHIEPTVYARILGGVLGCLVDATGYAQESLNADEEQREATIKFFTGLAFAMIPSVGGYVAGEVGSKVFKHFTEEGANYLQGEFSRVIEEDFNALLSNSFNNGDEASVGQFYRTALSIFNTSLRQLPNGQSINGDSTQEQFDFQSEFYEGFDDTTQYTRYDDAAND